MRYAPVEIRNSSGGSFLSSFIFKDVLKGAVTILSRDEIVYCWTYFFIIKRFKSCECCFVSLNNFIFFFWRSIQSNRKSMVFLRVECILINSWYFNYSWQQMCCQEASSKLASIFRDWTINYFLTLSFMQDISIASGLSTRCVILCLGAICWNPLFLWSLMNQTL